MPDLIRHIACCIDDSDAGTAALDHAQMLAELTGAPLSVVHVIAPPPFLLTMAAGIGGAPVHDDDAQREAGLAWLQAVADGRGDARAVLLEGHPGETACSWAVAESVDLIVVASHRGRVERALLGSFASYVSHHAPCPVLLIPPTATHES